VQQHTQTQGQNEGQLKNERVFSVEFWRRMIASLMVGLILLVIGQTIGVIAAAMIWKSAFEQRMTQLAASDIAQTKLLEQHALLLSNLSTFTPSSRVDRLEDKLGELRSSVDRLSGSFEQFVNQARGRGGQSPAANP
jgi:hypothetical protein